MYYCCLFSIVSRGFDFGRGLDPAEPLPPSVSQRHTKEDSLSDGSNTSIFEFGAYRGPADEMSEHRDGEAISCSATL